MKPYHDGAEIVAGQDEGGKNILDYLLQWADFILASRCRAASTYILNIIPNRE